MTIHVVQAGETVGSIAESYGVDPARLAADNAVPPSGALAVGQTLVVRFPRQVHAVRAGETLASIAEAYGTTVRRLWQNNWPLGGGAALQPGQVLVISYFDEPLGAAAFNGYAYPYIDMSLLDAELPYLTYLTPFTYGITADGDLLQLEDDALLSAARQRGVRPVMHLSTMTETGQFDTQRATLVLTDSAVQDRLVDQVQGPAEGRAGAPGGGLRRLSRPPAAAPELPGLLSLGRSSPQDLRPAGGTSVRGARLCRCGCRCGRRASDDL